MSATELDYLRLKSSIAVVERGDFVEFFKTNTRDGITIKTNFSKVYNLVSQFDGHSTLSAIAENNPNIDSRSLLQFADFLNGRHILIADDEPYTNALRQRHTRLLGLLEDYATHTSHVIKAVNRLYSATVLIIGMGSVGTWIATNLARMGVRNFELVDDDVVEESNLHRQQFFEDDIGTAKVDAIASQLRQIGDVNIKKYKERLDDEFFYKHELHADLVINCADQPSVDATTRIVGEACMDNHIPHIIGGGYNLHLTLIGQAVLPGHTPCVQCFEKHMRPQNETAFGGIKKLSRRHRNIGSFAPLSGISASIAAIEALKILAGLTGTLVTTGKRIEFHLDDFDFHVETIPQDIDCPWCAPTEDAYL